MKKSVFLFLFVAIAAMSFGFAIVTSKGAAEVEQEQGLYLFIKSKPTTEYEFLGTVKTGAVVPNYKFETILDILLKRAKKDYPAGEAIIMRDYEADVIKFK